MWKCHKCGKPVFFAERKTSLGYEWHPECLRCEECGKRLNPGQHAEHKGVPYCHVPCYSVLFGPTLFGHGSQVEAHTSFGKNVNRQGTPVPRSHLEAKLRLYNNYFEGKAGIIQSRERNGRLILEGSLRIFWGVSNVIHLKEDNDDRIPVRRRKSCQFIPDTSNRSPKTINNNEKQLTNEEKAALLEKDPNLLNSLLSLPMSDAVPLSEINLEVKNVEKEGSEENTIIPTHYKTLPAGGLKSSKSDNSHTLTNENPVKDKCNNVVQLRRRPRVQKSKLKRRCSINGHFYNRETSVFTPAYASVTSVWVTSLVTAPEVINMLLDKFKVVNNPEDFALYVVRDTGERRIIQDHEYPLLVRAMLGPSEDVAKVFIMNKYLAKEITCEVAQYIKFSDTELKMFLHKFNEEEKKEAQKIVKKYQEKKAKIQARMDELKEIQQTGL
ncbi:ras association domain-containing protein 2 [Trichonephila inaurata madagascariensis]|uniref:Ras association domain-containing protein 2 n=1 Tax=Trichonephila inaurata madagascariensis TaxID=2747483 RepID=A0A8X6YPS9_9ARAC|nr:ras association domain-containing protein 2 [Trichonephila inaurata madagascariensis]